MFTYSAARHDLLAPEAQSQKTVSINPIFEERMAEDWTGTDVMHQPNALPFGQTGSLWVTNAVTPYGYWSVCLPLSRLARGYHSATPLSFSFFIFQTF